MIAVLLAQERVETAHECRRQWPQQQHVEQIIRRKRQTTGISGPQPIPIAVPQLVRLRLDPDPVALVIGAELGDDARQGAYVEEQVALWSELPATPRARGNADPAHWRRGSETRRSRCTGAAGRRRRGCRSPRARGLARITWFDPPGRRTAGGDEQQRQTGTCGDRAARPRPAKDASRAARPLSIRRLLSDRLRRICQRNGLARQKLFQLHAELFELLLRNLGPVDAMSLVRPHDGEFPVFATI